MKAQTKPKITLIIALLILLAVLNLAGFPGWGKNFFYNLSNPILDYFWQAGDSVSEFFSGLTKGQELKRQVEELELKNVELSQELVNLKETEGENERLRQALDIGLADDFALVSADIISKDISQDSILINKGSKDGLVADYPVITEQKVLLGKVGQVYDNFSEVILISNSTISFDAKILDKEIQGVAKGGGNYQLFLDFVPKDKDLSPGDAVITTSLGNIFPKGLLAGHIREAIKSDVEAFQAAKIAPSFDIKNISSLFVITNFND